MNKNEELSTWEKITKFGFEIADIVVSTFAIVAVVCTFILIKFDVSGNSMRDTLYDGDRLFVWHLFYCARCI